MATLTLSQTMATILAIQNLETQAMGTNAIDCNIAVFPKRSLCRSMKSLLKSWLTGPAKHVQTCPRTPQHILRLGLSARVALGLLEFICNAEGHLMQACRTMTFQIGVRHLLHDHMVLCLHNTPLVALGNAAKIDT